MLSPQRRLYSGFSRLPGMIAPRKFLERSASVAAQPGWFENLGGVSLQCFPKERVERDAMVPSFARRAQPDREPIEWGVNAVSEINLFPRITAIARRRPFVSTTRRLVGGGELSKPAACAGKPTQAPARLTNPAAAGLLTTARPPMRAAAHSDDVGAQFLSIGASASASCFNRSSAAR